MLNWISHLSFTSESIAWTPHGITYRAQATGGEQHSGSTIMDYLHTGNGEMLKTSMKKF
jgi:hypothetical protein